MGKKGKNLLCANFLYPVITFCKSVTKLLVTFGVAGDMGEGIEEGITKAVAIDGDAIGSRLWWFIALSLVSLFILTMISLEMLRDRNNIWIRKL